MSSFTRCNFCSLKIIRKDAKAKNMKVTLMHDAKWGMGGTNVYVHPPDVDIRSLPGGEEGERKKYRWTWMMGIGDHCSC